MIYVSSARLYTLIELHVDVMWADCSTTRPSDLTSYRIQLQLIICVQRWELHFTARWWWSQLFEQQALNHKRQRITHSSDQNKFSIAHLFNWTIVMMFKIRFSTCAQNHDDGINQCYCRKDLVLCNIPCCCQEVTLDQDISPYECQNQSFIKVCYWIALRLSGKRQAKFFTTDNKWTYLTRRLTLFQVPRTESLLAGVGF